VPCVLKLYRFAETHQHLSVNRLPGSLRLQFLSWMRESLLNTARRNIQELGWTTTYPSELTKQLKKARLPVFCPCSLLIQQGGFLVIVFDLFISQAFYHVLLTQSQLSVKDGAW